MRPLSLILIALCTALPLALRAQESTNAPATEIENFDLQNDAVIVKGTGDIGTLDTPAGTVFVRCKESDNITSGQKQYAIAVGLSSNEARGVLFVDYDELDALIRGLDYLSKVTYDVTTMPSFDAIFTTRSGLRAAAYSEQRQASIRLYLQFDGTARIPLTPYQFSQFQTLVNQAKAALDAAKNKNSSS
jgi:hypothetical protein